jgi:thiol-disulfide isomerase/thioredoxin
MNFWLLLAASDGRGWSPGQPAARTAEVLTVPAPLPFAAPDALARRLDRPTALFYFAPGCPHCQHVAAEVAALHERLLASGAAVLGVAVGSSADADIRDFERRYGIDFPILVDRDREIARALGARATPTVVLVTPRDGTVVEIGRWAPYEPTFDAFVEARLAPGGLFSLFTPGAYQGTAVCGACHATEHRSWSLTHHSVAWRTLVQQEATAKGECVGCHVIGMGAPGGWSFRPHDPLVDVGCEACHGPGGPHDGARSDPLASCEGCHDAAHSLAFDKALGVRLIDHYRAGSMDDAAWRTARLALLDGEVERALVALPEGPTVGAAACATCHPAEHTQWRLTAHASARATLGAPADPACLTCHATAAEIGRDVGVRADESVGCESCHGPGAAHVAAAGALGTIQGLGEDCPVCVIEAICTTCHTRKWDPDWDLDVALPAVRH